MNKKAVFFSTDALIALIIIFISILIIYPLLKYSHPESELPGDIIQVFSSLKVGEINTPYIQSLIASGEITDLNKSVLEQIGDFYVNENPKAKELSYELLSTLNTSENIGIWYGNELLASKNHSSYETSTNVEVERQIISGIEKGKASKGFVAKAWLKKINQKQNTIFIRGDLMCGGWKHYSWGDYCGNPEATATYQVNIPENAVIKEASWLAEPAWTPQFTKLYINGNKIFEGNINYYSILNITDYLLPGNNTATIYGAIGAEDGASHITVTYETPDMQTFSYQKKFPFNTLNTTSLLHYEKSVFIPTEISEINISINSSLDTTLSFRKGANSFQIAKKNPVNNQVVFSNAEIQNALNSNGLSYSDLSNEYFFFILDIGKDNLGVKTILGENSYVYVDSSEITIPYGAIDISQEIPITSYLTRVTHTFYRNLTWKFYLPKDSIPLVADWQFGWFVESGVSGQKATANGVSLYSSPPDPFIEVFSRFGYTPSRATGVFQEGENNFTLDFGNSYSVSNEASNGYVLYFIKSYVNYGEAKEKAKGGTRTIEFESGSPGIFHIGNSADPWDPDIDAIDDAVERLLSQLDSNNNSKIDLIIDQSSFDIDSLDISGVPYIWSTEIQVRRWS